MKKPELLAPAGDMERLEAALRFGADAVYLGGPLLQLRAKSAGFSMDQLSDASRRIHSAGRRMYVAVNAVLRNREIGVFTDYIRELSDLGANGVIVSDLGALRIIKRVSPELSVHVSTQANCMNTEAARMYYDLGASRIVLARETTMEEIMEIRANTPEDLELECFVHGAMCMAYSGRCLLSAWMHGRSANRGACSQPCRYLYEIRTEGIEGAFPVIEENGATTVFSSRDLNVMPFLDLLIEAGISSLKIEGRMKSVYYVATVVNAYRRRLDGTASQETCLAELNCVSHRPYTSGFYFGEAFCEEHAGPEYIQTCTFVAIVLEIQKNAVLVEQRNSFSVGEELEVLSPSSMGLRFLVTSMSTEDGQSIDHAPHPRQRLLLIAPDGLQPGDLLRRRN